MPEDKGRKGIAHSFDPLLLAKLGRLTIMARYVVEGVITGLHRSPYRGISTEFTEHRQYAPGDEIRRIDWKAYGRMDKYFVKEYEEETNLKAYIMVDCSASMAHGKPVSKLKYASMLASALAYLLLRQRDSVGMVTYSDRVERFIPPRSSFDHLEVITSELEGREAGRKTNTGYAIEALASGLKRRGLIIVISDLLDDLERVSLSLKHLRHKKNDVIVFQIMDEDELTFPFRKPTLFVDMESEDKIITSPADIRKEYRVLLTDFLERVKRSCHANYVDHALFCTIDPLDQALVRYLARREAIR